MSYRCIICNTINARRYILCEHPLCPDGRDQPMLHRDPEQWVQAPRLLLIALIGNFAVWGLLIWGLWYKAH